MSTVELQVNSNTANNTCDYIHIIYVLIHTSLYISNLLYIYNLLLTISNQSTIYINYTLESCFIIVTYYVWFGVWP